MKKYMIICLAAACLLTLSACSDQSGNVSSVSENTAASSISSESSDTASSTTESDQNSQDSQDSSKDTPKTSGQESVSAESIAEESAPRSSTSTSQSSEKMQSRILTAGTFHSSSVTVDQCNISAQSGVYDPEQTLPQVRVIHNGIALQENIDYSLRQPSGKKKLTVGKNSVIVTLSGSLSGSANAEYYLFPRPVTFQNTQRTDKGLSLSWKAPDKADQYEVEYSTDPAFPDSLTERQITQKNSCIITGLTENQRYYVRVRACCQEDNDTLCSDWCDTRTILTGGKDGSALIEEIDGVTYVDGILIVNKTYGLPQNYGSGLEKEAANAFCLLTEAAAQDGISIWDISDFRSYETQRYTYQSYVWDRGTQEADRCSARPGHSEHQTGLAIDVNTTADAFADTAEARWLEQHCMEYGFIIRYPKGKEDVTGYKYEPWHIRYLGIEKAKEISDSGLTLEEYYGLTSEYQD